MPIHGGLMWNPEFIVSGVHKGSHLKEEKEQKIIFYWRFFLTVNAHTSHAKVASPTSPTSIEMKFDLEQIHK